jgi:hypothetical protein
MVFFKSDVQAKISMNKEGKFELKREEEPAASAVRRRPIADMHTEMMPLEAEAAAAMAEPIVDAGFKKCNRCSAKLEDENRLMEHLYRCPNCKMLVDLAPPPPPPSQSSSRNKGLRGGGY